MTIILLISSLLLPLLLGNLLVLNLWSGGQTWRTADGSEASDVPAMTLPLLILRLVLGAGLGLGLASLVSFAGLLLIGPSPAFSYAAELGICILLVTALVLRRAPLRRLMRLQRTPRSEVDSVFLAGFGIVLLPACVSMILASVRSPHGHWDAWAIWNLHARFLHRGGAYWTNLFSLQFSNPDYPLLLPALVARGWAYTGNETQAAPALFAVLFGVLTVGLLAAGLSHLRGTALGAMGGAILASTPFFVTQAAGQLADTPLAFYMLAAMVCLLLAEHAPEGRRSLTLLAGAAAGCAAWTKNEGFLFLLLLALTVVVIQARARGWRVGLGQAGALLLGALPFVCAWLYLKIELAPPNKMMSSLTSAHVTSMLLQPARYAQIARAFIGGIFHFGDWPIDIMPLLVVAAPLLGLAPKREHLAGLRMVVALLGLMLAGYVCIYLVTPADLTWHLQSSLDRLLLQLWPGVLLAYFLVLRLPTLARRKA